MNLFLISEKFQNLFKLPLKNKPLIEKPIIKNIMRIGIVTITILITTSVQLLFALPLKSQPIDKVEIRVGLNNETLVQAFQKIEAQSPFHFMYRNEEIKNIRNLNLPVNKKSVEEFLKIILAGTSLTYRQVNDQILIMPVKNLIPDLTLKEYNFLYAPEANIVNGKITNSKGEPLVGVSITIKGTNMGTSTDERGSYSITVPENGILVFSYVGFTTQELAVNNQTTINVKLQEATAGLNEVVVTALGIKREARSLVYATQSVKIKEMIDIQDPNNFLNSFQGKISNALITQSLGGVGSKSSIILRGNRSIQGSSDALIVIDGVPSNFETPMVNPNDIESITVLKGASAGALYGSQAGNGVIVITTKKGSTQGKVLVNLNSGIVLNSVYALPPMQNTYGQGNEGVLDSMSGSSWGAKMEGQTYTDYKGNQNTYSAQPNNIKDFFNTGIDLNNSISFSGGTEKLQGYFSYVNVSTKGIIPTNNLISHNVNLKVTSKIGERLSVEGNFKYLMQKIENTRRGDKQEESIDIFQIPRNVSLSYAKDYEMIGNSGLPAPNFWPTPDIITYPNPYWQLLRNTQADDLDQALGYINVKYKITDWLNVTGDANLSKTFKLDDTKVWDGTNYNPTTAGGTFIRDYERDEQQWFDIIFEGTNNVTKNLKANYSFGGIYKDNTHNLDLLTARGLNVPNEFSLNYATTSIMNSSSTEIQTQSVFGQLNLSYKNDIFLDGSLRNDWSSLLPAPHSFQYYSAGLSAILSSLFTLPESISYLKTSINYAEVGNGGQFGLLRSIYNYTAGAGNGYLLRSGVLPFPNLKPEIVKNIELNAEMRLLHDRLSLDFSYYNSNSFNQLISIAVPPASGYGSKYINAGNIRNRGVEFTLGGDPIKSSDFDWNIALNFSLNRNKVLKLADNLKTIYLNYFASDAMTTQVTEGGAFGDIYSNYWLKNTKGAYLVTADGLPLTSDISGVPGKLVGNFNPREMIGMTNTFNYKQFSLRLLIDGRIGGEVMSGVDMDLVFNGGPAATEKFREGGWNLGGVDANGQKVTSTITAQEFWQWVSTKRYGVGEFFVYDATNFRVREVALGYSIPLTNKSFIKSARISLVARNLFFLYRGSTTLDIPGLGKRKMWFDPDMTGGGIQFQELYKPSTRVIGFNLNVNF